MPTALKVTVAVFETRFERFRTIARIVTLAVAMIASSMLPAARLHAGTGSDETWTSGLAVADATGPVATADSLDRGSPATARGQVGGLARLEPTPNGRPAVRTAAARSGFVTACGVALCLAGKPWRLHGASVFAGLDDPGATVARAARAGLNTIRIVNFLDEDTVTPGAEYSEVRWERVDGLVAAAGARGLKVILDLSTYRNMLARSGRNPYTHDWAGLIEFAANRINTKSGLRYGSDPTIAIVAMAGEVEPINTPNNVLGVTTQQVSAFYERAFKQWRQHDREHLLSSGGLLHFGWDSGIDWRSIFDGADICSIHNYSAEDVSATPTVASFCAGLGKPWITEEFGVEQTLGDAGRARAFAEMYELQERHGAAGAAFWNLGAETVQPTFDVNQRTPLTWEVVRQRSPVAVSSGSEITRYSRQSGDNPTPRNSRVSSTHAAPRSYSSGYVRLIAS
jgi:hypothetical protein